MIAFSVLQISQAAQETVVARNLAKEAYDAALLASNHSDNMTLERADLVEKLSEFYNSMGATPTEIRNVALEVSMKFNFIIGRYIS